MRPKTSDPLVDSDTGLPRTPVAWRHRELHLPQANLMSSSYYQPIHQPLPSVISSNHQQHHQYQNHQNHQQYHHQNHHLHHHHQLQQQQHQPQPQPQHYSQSYHSSQQNSQHHHHPSSNQRTSSPSVLTTSSDDREEVPMVRHHHHSSSRRHNGGSVYSTTIDRRRSKHHSQSIVPRSSMARGSIVSYGPGPMRNYQRTATLRSTRSFPGPVMAQVGTFDGEPCPVHGSNHHLHPGPFPPPTASLTINPRHLPMASHHPIVNPYEHATSSSLLAHPVHSQPMLTVKRFNSLSDLRRPSLQPLIAYPMNGSALGLGSPQGAPTPNNYDCSGKSSGNKLPLPTYVGTMFRNKNGSTSFIPSGASMMIPGHGPAPIETIKSHLANQVNPLIYDDTVCCKGHLIVLWIILTVVTIGVISGIILGVTAN